MSVQPASPDSITDDEFEALLDQLQGARKPSESAPAPSPPQPCAPPLVPEPASKPVVCAPTVSATALPVRWVCFELGEQAYGVEVLHVQEVLPPPPVTPVPGAPSEVRGVINLRGSMVSVLDLHQRLGLGTAPARPASHVVVLNHKDRVVGILVERILDVLTLAPSSVLNPPAVNTQSRLGEIHGVARHQERLVVLLDVPGLLKSLSLSAETPGAQALPSGH